MASEGHGWSPLFAWACLGLMSYANSRASSLLYLGGILENVVAVVLNMGVCGCERMSRQAQHRPAWPSVKVRTVPQWILK